MTTENVLQKQTDASKIAKLKLSLLAEEQRPDPVLKTVRRRVNHKDKPTKNHGSRQSWALQSYINHFEALFIDPATGILCFIERGMETDTISIKICAPLNLFLLLFNLVHCLPLAGHMGKDKTLYNIKRSFYWPGM